MKNEKCFSETNFEIVYQYFNNKVAKELPFYTSNGYEVYLISETEIKIKKKGETIAIIRKEKGIFALAKSKSDNEKQLITANKLFCQLVEIAEHGSTRI